MGVTQSIELNSNYLLFERILRTHSITSLSQKISLHTGTLKRWQARKEVPASYRADLLRILGKKFEGGDARDKDQFFTKSTIAMRCLGEFKQVAKDLDVNLRNYHFIEPAAGGGSFYDILPEKRRLGLDIEPRSKNIHKKDFLVWTPNMGRKYIVIGNPPFGLRGNLALKFINHASKFADMVAFILPQLFESDGKGSAMKRVKEYKLAYSKKLERNSFYYPDGRDVDINTIFQVWTKVNTHKISIPPPLTCDSYIKVYSLSDGGTPSSTRNLKMIDKCDVYLPSTTFQEMKVFNSFEELPHRRGYGVVIHRRKRDIRKLLRKHDWNKTAFASTNSALNLRTSLIQKVVIDASFTDERLL